MKKKVAEFTPNPNTGSEILLAELMFARKIKSRFYKILPEQKGVNIKEYPY